ncbi:MAG: hypothetical protein AABX07_03830 [Nanoarchaeota archaeon]
MKLTKPMLKAFNLITCGENTLNKLAGALHKSVYWTDMVLNSLEEEEFITKKRNYTIKGSRFLIEIAGTIHASKLKELIFEYQGISFEDILTEGRLLFLAAISEDWMTKKIAAQLSRISGYSIDRYMHPLKNRGVIIKKNTFYTINQKGWSLLKEFLIAYKSYSEINGQVKWKYLEETIFQLNNENLVQDMDNCITCSSLRCSSPDRKLRTKCATSYAVFCNTTGFYEYKKYSISAGVISALCIFPKRKLSKEEVFVHSLFEINDPRTLHLALVFYLKNKLKYEKVFPIAMKYGKYTMFENIVKIIKNKEEKIKLEGMPVFDRKDFSRIAGMYEVKNV